MVQAQCTISSTSGYTVSALIYPIALVPSTDNCPWGYNYNVRLAYDISFSGPGAPASMWTLQGTVQCGSQSHFFNLPNGGGSGEVTSQSNQWRGVADCNTADIHSLSCYTVNLQISGPGISNRTVVCDFSPLPVELVAFEAEATTEGVLLQWRTGTERNSDHFMVERSTDGISFRPVATVAAAGESLSQRHYETMDHAPENGMNYYRLRMVDQDGTEQLSSWAVVHRRPETARPQVYPNPNRGNLLHTRNTVPGSTLQLHSPTGVLVHQSTIRDDRVVLPETAPGLYLGLIIAPDGTAESFRYVQE